MSLSNIFDISASGMSAQSIRLNTVASNIANAESVSSSSGETYRARQPVFSLMLNQQMDSHGMPSMDSSEVAGYGVQVTDIVESEAPLRMQYEPNHPMADDEGYVYYSNVNVVEEMTNMISASRSYQVNADIMNTAKEMMQRVLTLGQN